jgi:AcrR family transcriptional regulator
MATGTADDALLAACEPVFARRGYEAPTMDELAAACACARRTLYRHYPTKDDLFWAVALRAYGSLADRLRNVAAVWEHAGTDTVGRLRSWSNAYLDFASGAPDSFRVIMAGRERAVAVYREAAQVPDQPIFRALAALDQEVLGSLRSLGERWASERQIPPGDASRALWELIAVLIGIIEFHARYQGGGRDLPFGSTEGVRSIIDFEIQARIGAASPAGKGRNP